MHGGGCGQAAAGAMSRRGAKMEAVGWIVGAVIVAIVVAPFALSFVHRLRHRQRRRLVDSPRKIRIADAAAAAAAGACAERGHVRDGRRVRPDGDGGYLSWCKRCGTRLGRTRDGAWHAVQSGEGSGVGAAPAKMVAEEGLEPPTRGL